MYENVYKMVLEKGYIINIAMKKRMRKKQRVREMCKIRMEGGK